MRTPLSLTWLELFHAAVVGVTRNIEALAFGRRDDLHGKPTLNPWVRHIEAAATELVSAKFLNEYWNALAPKPRELKSDMGTRTQIRSSMDLNGHLIIHPDDPDDGLFYLVIGTAPHFEMLGPVRAGDVKRPEYWTTFTGRPAFWIPQAVLL
ncbi:MAG TPA: hypothetical protein VH080_03565 [Gemmatimonadaceae bacterium]|jgi:hypothetical protein|nr:hypothetical protein [Gemmatimonadaceae bacterium]